MRTIEIIRSHKYLKNRNLLYLVLLVLIAVWLGYFISQKRKEVTIINSTNNIITPTPSPGSHVYALNIGNNWVNNNTVYSGGLLTDNSYSNTASVYQEDIWYDKDKYNSLSEVEKAIKYQRKTNNSLGTYEISGVDGVMVVRWSFLKSPVPQVSFDPKVKEIINSNLDSKLFIYEDGDFAGMMNIGDGLIDVDISNNQILYEIKSGFNTDISKKNQVEVLKSFKP